MLDQFLATLPRRVIAVAVIGLGIMFIVFSNPPKTVCDSQYEHFVDAQKNVLFIDQKRKLKPNKTYFEINFDKCKTSNNAGGCFEFFQLLKETLRDLQDTPQTCYSDMGSRSIVKSTLWQSLELITRIAWGEKPPASYREANGWLESPNLVVFCQLKETIQNFYGKPRYTEFAKRVLPELPGAQAFPFEKAWTLSVLAASCQNFY